MRRVRVTFEAVLSEENAADLESADPALEYEYITELSENIDEHAPVGIEWLGGDDG